MNSPSSANRLAMMRSKPVRNKRRISRSASFEQLESRQLLAVTLFKINAGGPAVVSSPNWLADSVASPSSFTNASATGNKTTVVNSSVPIDLTHPSIPAGTPKTIFESSRWDPSAGAPMQWDFPVSPGDYEVRLYFAETFNPAKAVGSRVFDVSIEGQKLLSSYDIFAKVGGNKAIVEKFNVSSDGNLDIDFSHVKENPLVQGIEIISLSSGGGGDVAPAAINFDKKLLSGASIVKPTSLQFGPDGRLYVAQQDGLIKIFTVNKLANNNVSVTATETISLIQQIPNHNDDGKPNPAIKTRLVTGLLVAGSAANPVIYVSSSDPRIGAGPSGTDLNLDTNSGVVSKLTFSAGKWTKLDLVRGLPRSEENHTGNGLQLLPGGNILLLAQGGNTNAGAPSNNFALLPEFAYSAAILSIDLAAIGNTTYDMPTLDDENRPGVNDANDPFGGNNGKNQAKIVPGSPVQVYAPGFRNPYDVVVTSKGKVYTIDNGANAGWGGPPIGEGPAGKATNGVVNGGGTDPDGLHLVTKGYYGGHPNPTRSNMANKFNASKPQSPVTKNNPIESDYKPPKASAAFPDKNGSLITFNASTNGIAEYTASNFGGQLKGELLTVSFDNTVKRIKLNAAGTAVVSSSSLFSAVGSGPLDVTSVGDSGPLAGSVWVADYVGNAIVAYLPAGTSGGTQNDSDGDGYTNADELANGTNPNNSGDVPPDFDSDFISNLTDPDDDNDKTLDTKDKFAIDPQNGSNKSIGFLNSFENNQSVGGLFNLGFTGLMTNGVANYQSLYDPNKITAGAAAGVLTIDAAGKGTALGATNTQTQAFQLGFNAASAGNSKFAAKTSILAPFAGKTLEPGTEFGFYVGLGDQDNYVKLVINGKGGGQIALVSEVNGVATTIGTAPIALSGADFVNLDLVVDPVTKKISGRFQRGVKGKLDPAVTLTPQATVPASWITGVMAVGVISSDSTPQTPVSVTWDFIGVQAESSSSSSPPVALLNITPTGGLNASTFPFNSFTLSNSAATNGPKINSVTIDLSTAMLPDIVFDPVTPAAGDTVLRPLVVSTGAAATGFVQPPSILAPFSVPYQGGYRKMTLNFNNFGPGKSVGFAADIDPTTIKGLVGQGANWAGSISGLEMSGAKVTVSFSDGSQHVGTIFAVPGNNLGHATATIKPSPPAAPTISLVGITTLPATTSKAAQVVKVVAPPNSKVRLMVTEAALESAVFDVDAFEANNVRKVVKLIATVGSSGSVNVPITLTNSVPGGGLNYIVATIEDSSGRTGATSTPIIVKLNTNSSASFASLSAISSGVSSEPAIEQANSVDESTEATEPDSFIPTITVAQLDVSGDGDVTPLDALRIINAIARTNVSGESPSTSASFNTDVNGDGQTTALDALLVINYMSRQARSAPLPQADAFAFIQEDEDSEALVDEAIRDYLVEPF